MFKETFSKTFIYLIQSCILHVYLKEGYIRRVNKYLEGRETNQNSDRYAR